MRILVSGGAGFIGSHFVDAARAAGHDCHIFDSLTYAGRSANLDPAGPQPIKVDICDPVLVGYHMEWIRPDWIVHLAAESHVARSIESRDEFIRTNVGGTQVLLEAAHEYWTSRERFPTFRFLHVSTDEVYGSLGPDDAPWTEASPYAPNNPYAASKASSDFLVRAYHRTFGLPCIITHASNNYGPRQHPEKLIPTLIGQVLRGEPMTIHGTGAHVRDWLHVEDHCEGLLAALEKGTPGHCYNFGGQCERSNILIANLVHAVMSPSSQQNIRLVGDRLGNDLRYASNVGKAERALGWKPGPQIGSRLKETVQWYTENPNYEESYGR